MRLVCYAIVFAATAAIGWIWILSGGSFPLMPALLALGVLGGAVYVILEWKKGAQARWLAVMTIVILLVLMSLTSLGIPLVWTGLPHHR